MLRHLTARPVVVGLVSLALIAGCGSGKASPVAPSTIVMAPPPVVTAVAPNFGSTGGGTTITITGTGLMGTAEGGITVTLDATRATKVTAAGTLDFFTPAHAPGTVDLVVTNPDGQFHRLEGAYTYVSPESFDLNGQWDAVTWDGSDRVVAFTIRDNKLVSASCSYEDTRPLPLPSPLPSVRNGEFSFVGSDGVSMSGRIVAPSEVIGTMNFPPCTNMTWRTWPRTVPKR